MHPAPFDSLFFFDGGGGGVRVWYVCPNSFLGGPWRFHRKELIHKSAEQVRMLSQFLEDTNLFTSQRMTPFCLLKDSSFILAISVRKECNL